MRKVRNTWDTMKASQAKEAKVLRQMGKMVHVMVVAVTSQEQVKKLK